MTERAITLRVGSLQLCGLEIYIFDPCHDEENFPGSLAGFVLTITDRERACELLTDAANSADDDGDAAVRDALTTLCARLRRA